MNNEIERLSANIQRIIGHPVQVSINCNLIRIPVNGGFISIGRITPEGCFDIRGRKIDWWYDWYRMRSFMRSVLQLQPDNIAVEVENDVVVVRDGNQVHRYENGAADHSIECPRWLSVMPESYPAVLVTPAGTAVVANSAADIPKDVFGTYGANLYKFAYEHGLKFTSEEHNNFLAKYATGEQKRAAVKAAIECIINITHTIKIVDIEVRLPRDTLIGLVMAELDYIATPIVNDSDVVPFA